MCRKIAKQKYSDHRYDLIFGDFESVVVNDKHYMSGYVLVSDDLKYSGVIDYTGSIEHDSRVLCDKFMNDCESYIKSHRFTNQLFFFHNLGKFDCFFLLDHCTRNDLKYDINLVTRGSKIYKVIITYNGIKMEIRDTLLLCPLSLEEIGNKFNKKHKKMKFDHLNSYEDYKDDIFTTSIMIYCENDVMTLKEGFMRYIKAITDMVEIDPLRCLSLPGAAMKSFRTNYYDDVNCPLYTLDKNKDSFVRSSYTGGIVDVYKPVLKDGHHYDINSLYPHVMMNNDFPIGPGVWVSNGGLINMDDFFGFVDVDIEVDYIKIPLLPYMARKRGLLSPIGKWRGVYFSEEIKEAIKLGYKIKINRGLKFGRGKIFTNFIDKLYSIRIKTDKNDPMNFVAKLIMNSLYGRFGMKLDHFATVIISEDELNELLLRHDVYDYRKLNDKLIVSYNTSFNSKKMFQNRMNGALTDKDYHNYVDKLHDNIVGATAVQVASAITSYARLLMYPYKDENTCYSDTDSIFTDVKLDDMYVDNKKLGMMKYEGKVKKGYFISPKLYYVEYDDGKTTKTSKGFNAKDLKEEDYVGLLDRRKVKQPQFRSFIRNLMKMEITTGMITKEISGDFYKRGKTYDKSGKWVDTHPLILNDDDKNRNS